ncbi:MAG: pyrroloquinoline quinone biosynthesis protein PqqB [Hyphomicrobiaceae bacterium]
MIIKILGSAAGGGFPQWNCNGHNSRSVRAGKRGFQAATQSSIAVSRHRDAGEWVICNASPDIREQINANFELQPHADGPLRNSPIAAVVLTNADVDHVAGLLSLREGQRFALYGSERVLSTLSRNSIFDVLDSNTVARRIFALDHPVNLAGPSAQLGISLVPFVVPGKIALYLEDANAGEHFGTEQGDTIGLKLSDAASGRSAFYIPGCAGVDARLAERLKGADLVLFDGTLFTDDEMISEGLSHKTGRRMGHISMSGPDGSIAALSELGIGRRIFVHINNSNPVLNATSEARKLVEAAGWEVAYDGMELEL